MFTKANRSKNIKEQIKQIIIIRREDERKREEASLVKRFYYLKIFYGRKKKLLILIKIKIIVYNKMTFYIHIKISTT